MKRFIVKLSILSIVVMGIILGINCIVDPANLFHDSLVYELVEELNKGNTVISPGDFDEELFDEKMIETIDHTPQTIIIGSSHIMYADWDSELDDYLILGLSGANLGDYYSLVGLMDHYGRLPKKIIIGMDSWALLDDASNGRHAGLAQYSFSLRQKIGNATDDKAPSSGNLQFTKAKEMISFPYFQSSFKKIISSPSEAFRQNTETIQITDNSVSDIYKKITPSCRRIQSTGSFETLEEMNMSADYQISIGSIYSMGLGCDEINPENYKEFTDLMNYLKDRGVEVSIYLPAWYPSLYDYFTADDKYQFVLKLEEDLRSYTKDSEIEIHGSYSPYVCNLTEEDYADCLHIKPEKVLQTYFVQP